MLRRLVCVLFAMGMLLGLAVPGMAAEESGSVRVRLGNGEEIISSGSVTLYKAGLPVSGGYRLLPGFGGGLVAREDVTSPALAQWLAEQAGEDGTTLLLDADGCAEFSQLEEGLYLLVQEEAAEGYYPMVPFTVQLPCEGEWDVQAVPKTQKRAEEVPRTGQHPAPILAAMGLVASGLGLVLFADRKNKRK